MKAAVDWPSRALQAKHGFFDLSVHKQWEVAATVGTSILSNPSKFWIMRRQRLS
jgi:hypothetical protein